MDISGPIVLDRNVPNDSVNSTLLVDLNHDCVTVIDQVEVPSVVGLTVALAVARNKRALIIAGIMGVLVCFHGVSSTHTESTITKTYLRCLVELASSFTLEATVHHLCHYSPSTTSIKVADIAVTRYFKISLNFELLQLIIEFLPLEFFFKLNCHLVEYWKLLVFLITLCCYCDFWYFSMNRFTHLCQTYYFDQLYCYHYEYCHV